jgi:hypothetical protein
MPYTISFIMKTTNMKYVSYRLRKMYDFEIDLILNCRHLEHEPAVEKRWGHEEVRYIPQTREYIDWR